MTVVEWCCSLPSLEIVVLDRKFRLSVIPSLTTRLYVCKHLGWFVYIVLLTRPRYSKTAWATSCFYLFIVRDRCSRIGIGRRPTTCRWKLYSLTLCDLAIDRRRVGPLTPTKAIVIARNPRRSRITTLPGLDCGPCRTHHRVRHVQSISGLL